MRSAAVGVIIAASIALQPALVHSTEFAVGIDPSEIKFEVIDNLTRVQLSGESFEKGQPGQPALPWRLVWLSTSVTSDQLPTFHILDVDSVWLAQPVAATEPPIATRCEDDSREPVVAVDATWRDSSTYPEQPVIWLNEGTFLNHELTALGWCPFRYHHDSGLLEVIHRARITVGGDYRPDSTGAIGGPPIESFEVSEDLPVTLMRDCVPIGTGAMASPAVPGSHSTIATGLPIGCDYVLVTNAALAPSFMPLAHWKAARGYNVGIALIEQVVATYSGVDDAARLRAYLSDAYSSGLKWALLGGDETVIPIRYAFHGYTTPPPANDLYNYQICDMYFAEFDGDWDADGDGVWGEFFGDNAEFTTEIGIGRLPVSTPTEVQAAIDKIIAYERGWVDPDRLANALHGSADQMRDWADGVGQHTLLAQAMGPQVSHDLLSMVEAPTGDAANPEYPFGPEFISKLADGWGWVDLCVHGRSDGFAVSAPGINLSPRNFVWTTGTAGDGHGHFPDAAGTGMFGIWNSIACDQGGFDMDAPPFVRTTPCVAQEALTVPDGGAVAFIGYSRWGWVGSSYRMTEKFYQYAFDNALPNHLGDFVRLSKLAYPSYRDLVFGMNLYGDPEMPVWRESPEPMTMESPTLLYSGANEVTLSVTSHNGQPVVGACGMLQIGDSTWALGTSNVSGEISCSIDLPWSPQALVTVTAERFAAAVDSIPFSIATDVFDDGDGGTPQAFSLGQNAPNPFNASTAINFSLGHATNVNLDVYDILGRRVRSLIDRGLEPGARRVAFDGRDDDGRELATGVYFYRLVTDSETATRKMLLLH